MKTKPFPERFWDKVQKTDGCWLWTGHCKPGRYGMVKLNGKVKQAHRVAFEIVKGPIPAGLYCCHTCDNPPCVNPDHIFLGTQKANVADCIAKGRSAAVGRTHCRRGHPFTTENAVKNGNNKRYCRTCFNAAQRISSKLRRQKAHLQREIERGAK